MRYLIKTVAETEITIGKNLIDKAGEILKPYQHSAYVVLCTKTTKKLYSDKLIASLSSNNAPIDVYELPEGEAAKTMEVVSSICNEMLSQNIDRKAAVVALGGGGLGDTATVIAGLYRRGIDVIQIPTTLLAQVDSSLGGKGAVNVGKYKNMLGVVHQPKAVIIDTTLLSSLSKEQVRSGMGEVIKYAIAFDDKLFTFLENTKVHDDNFYETIITSSVERKMERVQKDPLDKNDIRIELNFGHTLGHAIELTAGLSHGESVAIGMVFAIKASVAVGILNKEVATKAINLIKQYKLPTSISGINRKDVLAIMEHDKKSIKGAARFVLLKNIGNVTIDVGLPKDIMEQMFSEVAV